LKMAFWNRKITKSPIEATSQEQEILGRDKIYMMPGPLKALLFYGGIVFLGILAYGMPALLGRYFGWSGIIIGCLLIPITVFIFVFAIWAPRDITWTMVTENQNKAVYYLGGFNKILFTSKEKLLIGNKVVKLTDLTCREIKVLKKAGRIKTCSSDDPKCETRLSEAVKWEGLPDKETDDLRTPEEKKENSKMILYIEPVKETMRKIFGGLHFVGPYPFYKIATFVLPAHVQILGTEEKPHPREHIHSVSSVEIPYGIPLDGVVDLDLLPIEGELMAIGTMEDMELFIIATPDGLVQALGTIHSEFTHFARKFPYKKLNENVGGQSNQPNKKNSEDDILGSQEEVGSAFWAILKEHGTLEEIRKKSGIWFSAIKAVRPLRSPKYEEKVLQVHFADIDGQAAAAKAEGDAKANVLMAKGEAAANVAKAKGDAEVQTITIGTVKQIFESLKDLVSTDAERAKLFEWCQDMVRRHPYITTKQAVDIWINGGQTSSVSGGSIEETVLRASIAGNMAAQQLSNRGGQSSGTGGQTTQSTASKKDSKDSSGEKKKKTPQEEEAEFLKRHGLEK
jgi:hypothetical protein